MNVCLTFLHFYFCRSGLWPSPSSWNGINIILIRKHLSVFLGFTLDLPKNYLINFLEVQFGTLRFVSKCSITMFVYMFSVFLFNLFRVDFSFLFYEYIYTRSKFLPGWVHFKFVWFYWVLFCSFHNASDINIDCRGDVSFTSPNYPSNYPDDAHTKWVITAPEGRRILVTFTDFNVETDDFLYVADKVDTQNSMRYTGEQMQFPPFLTKGNELKMTFISFSSETRKGFNVSSSCYTNSSNYYYRQNCFETMQ